MEKFELYNADKKPAVHIYFGRGAVIECYDHIIISASNVFSVESCGKQLIIRGDGMDICEITENYIAISGDICGMELK